MIASLVLLFLVMRYVPEEIRQTLIDNRRRRMESPSSSEPVVPAWRKRWLTYPASGFVPAVLDEVLHATSSSGLGEVAGALGQRLASGLGTSRGWAFFAGVDMSDAEITCCVAGPHRVHLIQGDSLVASTHEHTVQYDGPPTDWPSPTAEQLSLHANVVVRSIGYGATRPPEMTRWAVRGPCRVAVVSTDFYGYRQPSAYALSIGAGPRDSNAITGSYALLTRR